MFTSWGKIEYSGNKILLAQHDEIRRDFWDYSGATFCFDKMWNEFENMLRQFAQLFQF